MAKISCQMVAPGLDDELVEVGRPVTAAKIRLIAEAINAQVARRRKNPGLIVYQRDQSNVTRGLPGSSTDHAFRWLTGPVTTHCYVAALTLGGVAGTGTARIRARTASAGDDKSLGRGDDLAATFPDNVRLHLPTSALEVDPDTVETLTVEQDLVTTTARILAIGVQELSLNELDTAEHIIGGNFGGMDPSRFVPGQDITSPFYSTLALELARQRRRQKKLLWSNGKECATDAAAYEDLTTRSPTTLHQWDYHSSVTLPETADPSVTATFDVLAQAIGGGAPTGDVRIVSAAGPTVTASLTNGTLQWWTGTGLINRGSGSFSVQARMTGTATSVRIYSRTLYELKETV